MKTFQTTPNNNDIFIAKSGQMAIATELEALINICENVVQTMLGELVLQGDTGMPNFQLIWNGAPNIAQAENALREALFGVEGVIDVPELSAFVQDNILRYSATIKSIYGQGAIGVV